MEEIENKQVDNLNKRYILIISIFIMILLTSLFVIYLFSNNSNVKNIKIINNYYLSDSYISEIININYDDKYCFVFPSFKELKVKNNPLIKNVSIKRGKNNTIIIDVSENKILGYIFEDSNVIGDYSDDYMQLVLEDGSLIDFDAKYIKGYGLLTRFFNVSEELLPLVVSELSKLKDDVLLRISEITITTFSYEENMVKLYTDDGYLVYCSIENINYVDNYIDIIMKTTSKFKCIYIYNDDDEYFANVVDCKDFVQ